MAAAPAPAVPATVATTGDAQPRVLRRRGTDVRLDIRCGATADSIRAQLEAQGRRCKRVMLDSLEVDDFFDAEELAALTVDRISGECAFIGAETIHTRAHKVRPPRPAPPCHLLSARR